MLEEPGIAAITLRRNPAFGFRSIDGEVFMSDGHSSLRLRGMPVRVWNALTSPRSYGQIAEELSGRLSTSPQAEAGEKLYRTVANLIRVGAVIASHWPESNQPAKVLSVSAPSNHFAFWRVPRPILLKLVIELTYRCNLGCDYCYAESPFMTEPPSIPSDRVESLLDEAAELGTLFVTLTGGEPTEHRDFLSIVKRAVALGFVVKVNTNGTHLTERFVSEIAGLPRVGFDVTVHGATPELHDGFTHVPGSFRQVMAGLQRLQETGIRATVKFVVTRRNVHEWSAVRRRAHDLGLRFSLSPLIYPTGFQRDEVYDLFCSDEQLAGLMAQGAYRPVPDPCGAGTTKLVVAADGVVYPCNFVREAVGNIGTSSLRHIWEESAQLHRMRNERWFEPSAACQACPSFAECPRCPAIALAQDGAIRGPSSQACRICRIFDRFQREGGVAAGGSAPS